MPSVGDRQPRDHRFANSYENPIIALPSGRLSRTSMFASHWLQQKDSGT